MENIIRHNIPVESLHVFSFEAIIHQLGFEDNYENQTFPTTFTGDINDIRGKKQVIIKYEPQYKNFPNSVTVHYPYDITIKSFLDYIQGIFYQLLQSKINDEKTIPNDYDKNFWQYDVYYTVSNFVWYIDYTDSIPQIVITLPVHVTYVSNVLKRCNNEIMQ